MLTNDLGRSPSVASRPLLFRVQLFAKHFKLSEHITYLSTTSILMAVGTPHRIAELLKDSSAYLSSPTSRLITTAGIPV